MSDSPRVTCTSFELLQALEIHCAVEPPQRRRRLHVEPEPERTGAIVRRLQQVIDLTEHGESRHLDAAAIENRRHDVSAMVILVPQLTFRFDALQPMNDQRVARAAGVAGVPFEHPVRRRRSADTPHGLVVPVIRDADRKDIYELADDLAVLSRKAREGKLSAGEMQGASFTVSSLGGIGGKIFTPIINALEVGILGIAKSSVQPVFEDSKFVPRLVLPFTFAYDHRVIDGAQGARFTRFFAKTLSDVHVLTQAVP